MIQTVGLLGAKGKDVERQMMDVYNLEYEIAKVFVVLWVNSHRL